MRDEITGEGGYVSTSLPSVAYTTLSLSMSTNKVT